MRPLYGQFPPRFRKITKQTCVTERKAPLAQGRTVGARVSAEPENYLLAGLASSALPPSLLTSASTSVRDRPSLGAGRIGLSPDYQRKALTPIRRAPYRIFFGAGAGYAISEP